MQKRWGGKSLLFALLLLAASLHAQHRPADYHSLKEESWFPKQSVLSVYQDLKGSLWIGTNAGLYHYNLNGLLNYNLSKKSKGKLLNNSVYAISEDKDGNILIGTESGLGALNVSTGEITRITSTDATIGKIYKGKAGYIWCLDNMGNVYRLISSGGKYKYELFVSMNEVLGTKVVLNDIFQLDDGTYLLAADKGLFQVNLIKKSVNRIHFRHQVTSIYSGDHHIYLGTVDQGIFSGEIRKEGSRMEFVSRQNFHLDADSGKNYVNDIAGLNDEHLVVSTPFAVYLSDRRDIQHSQRIGHGLSYQKEGMVNALLIDKGKNIWIGSQKGLYKYRQHTLTYDYYEIEPKAFNRESQVNDLLFDADRERLLIATSTDGIHALDPVKRKIFRVPFHERKIRSLTFASDNDLLINTASKLYKAQILENGKLNAQLLYADSASEINQILEVIPGEYWLTSWTGDLIRVSTRPDLARARLFEKIRKAIGPVNHLFCIEKDNLNNVWIGSRGDGIIKVSLSDGKVTHFRKHTKPAASSRIIAIDKDTKGRIWVSTRGDGLLLYDHQTNTFQVFDHTKGLPSNTVCSFIEASNGEIWVSTLSGLARFNEDNPIPFQSYGTEDGIYSTEFNFNVVAAANDGVVFFGSDSGVYGIHSADEHNTNDFPIVFTNFTILGQASSQPNSPGGFKDYLNFKGDDKQMVLKHNENDIQIAFSALDYTIPVKNRYAFKLIGYDQEWKFAKGESGIAEYYDLPPGEYKLEVKAANAGGKWAKTPALLEFSIQQSFWLSNIALLLYLLALVVIVLVVLFLWKKWFRLNNELLREKDELEKHQQQMVFYTDLSHEIKNRLSLILGPLEQALQGKKVNQGVLNNLYGQALRLNKLSNQILNIRKSEYGKFILSTSEKDINRVLNEVCEEMKPLAILKDLHFEFIPATETMMGWIDEELLEIIILNLLSNAIKYSNPQGSVRMKAEIQYLEEVDIKSNYFKNGNYLFCSITDTGIGIPQEGIDKVLDSFYRAGNTLGNREGFSGTGIGLDLVSRLIFLHKGWLDIESEQNESTVVNFYLPVDKKQYQADEIRPDKDVSIVISANLRGLAEEVIKPGIAEADPLLKREMYKVLVVEDDHEIRELIVNTLSPYYVVHSAANGTEAFSLTEEQRPDLILSDLAMPMMDGLTLCRAVRERFPEKYIPFIILTGRNSEEQKLISFQNGVDDFMEKPFSPELLRWRVKSMLQAFQKISNTQGQAGAEVEIPESADDRFIQEVIAIIDKNLDKDYLNVEFMANEMCMSRATFYRKMDILLSESPSTYIRKYRLKRAAILLSTKKYTIAEVSYHVGFNDPNYFAKCFQKEFNTSPSAYSS